MYIVYFDHIQSLLSSFYLFSSTPTTTTFMAFF